MRRGEVWWAALRAPSGSEPGYRRPVVVIQVDALNNSRISTVTVVAVTRTIALGTAPGNVVLQAGVANLAHPSVVNVTQVLTLDRAVLTGKIGSLPADVLRDVEVGLRLVLGL